VSADNALYAMPGHQASSRLSWASWVSTSLQVAVLVACVAQLLIEPATDNVVCSLLILGSSSLTIQYLRISHAFERVPLSAFALLGLCMTTQWGALVLQSACATPVTRYLRDPVRTFELLGLYQVVAVMAHAMFSHLRATLSLRRLIAERVLEPLGVFHIPRPGELWVMGVLGTAASYFTHTGFDSSTSDRVLASANFFFVAPFLIPLLHRRYGAAYCDLRVQGAVLVCYALVAFGLGIATNVRALTFGGVMATGVIYSLFALRDPRPVRTATMWKIGAAAVAGILALGFIGDLATAMLIGRAYRDRNHSQWDVIEETIDALRHPDKIQAYRERQDESAANSLYDEKYFDNLMLARLVETKFHDNMFFFSKDLRPEEWLALYHETTDRLWATLPTPVLKWLKIPVDKAKIHYSMGDFWVDLRYGKGVGGFATGSMLADGHVLFEPWFPVVYLGLCIFLFLSWESLSRPRASGEAQISIVALLMSVQIFQYGITAQSIDAVLTPLRALPQNIVVYLLVYWGTRTALAPFRPVAWTPAWVRT
jgi:hypothetical protein